MSRRDKQRQENREPSVNDIQRANRISVAGRNERQIAYIRSVRQNPLTVALGPSGTGKTYIPAAVACDMLLRGTIKKFVIVRPAIAAGGEEHGFLPGDMKKKIAPWARPVIDKMAGLCGRAQVDAWVEDGAVEAVPFTYMRGLEFNDALVLLDEAQNTTEAQMRLLTTRLGDNCRAVIDGDVSQDDLDRRQGESGLAIFASLARRSRLPCGVIEFTSDDVERSELCRAIVKAWEDYDVDG